LAGIFLSHPQQGEGLAGIFLSHPQHSLSSWWRERSNIIEDELIYSSAILRTPCHPDDKEIWDRIEEELIYSSVILSTASSSWGDKKI
jgi:hypothetical protein